METPKSVIGAMTYFRPTWKKADYSRDALDWRVNADLESREVAITDFRGRRNEAKLSTTGFELFDHQSRVTDFTSETQLSQIYIPEIKALISAITGAPKLYATPPVLRRDQRGLHLDTHTKQTVPPVRMVHADYPREDFHTFARKHMRERMQISDEREADHWLAGRYATYSVWRTVTSPPQDCPLAFIDRRTIAPMDMVVGRAADFCTLFCTWSARHQWGYFSDMTRDEVVIFLAFDSADDALPGPPHSAFDDPTCPADAAPRLSCEVRVWAYWG